MQNAKLQYEIAQIPPNQRFFTGKGELLLNYYCNNACVFGYGTYLTTEALDSIPPDTKGLYFYYGAGIKNLLEEILKLPVINSLEYLVIGITHNNDKYYADYNEITKLLSNSYFPNLKYLEYGVDQLIANEHCIYGNLGDISEVLGNMPLLEKLYLYGNFTLTKTLFLPLLTDLEVLMDDWATNINGGKITNDTLQHLLSSKFQSLRLMSLYLDFNDDKYDYSIPEAFLSGQCTPALKTLELKGKFKAGTKLQIDKNMFLNKQTQVDIEGLEESIV